MFIIFKYSDEYVEFILIEIVVVLNKYNVLLEFILMVVGNIVMNVIN